MRSSPMKFTPTRHHGLMRDPARRYGAIIWAAGIRLDDAIRAVKAFDDAAVAANYVAHRCGKGECWAVVDLATMEIVAEAASDEGALAL